MWRWMYCTFNDWNLLVNCRHFIYITYQYKFVVNGNWYYNVVEHICFNIQMRGTIITQVVFRGVMEEWGEFIPELVEEECDPRIIMAISYGVSNSQNTPMYSQKSKKSCVTPATIPTQLGLHGCNSLTNWAGQSIWWGTVSGVGSAARRGTDKTSHVIGLGSWKSNGVWIVGWLVVPKCCSSHLVPC